MLKDYFKCAAKNIYFVEGCALVFLSFLTEYVSEKNGVELPAMINPLYYLGCGLLGATEFGRETYRSYKRTKKHIKKYKTLDQRFKNKLSSYCTQTGIKIAVKESKLENFI